ncbi:MAG TPA: hypothetical protein VM261_01315 [Kofleriaceae bacterium]|nr:hypothetical protein [Kofleriaceae bacterium]
MRTIDPAIILAAMATLETPPPPPAPRGERRRSNGTRAVSTKGSTFSGTLDG